ncbi:PH domain-containing protein [Halomicrobium zhouii]|uniref:PH domain-containing protein n=1 Tax=Halomicrobium zhouii TaxID=767519 RepID=A0A1I6LUE4_9EURY|nr:PH domain-containing protein [Halomicrobium zhouii]SFS07006.1 PH domain-containing protein [Halomicrobium zhouii]
MATVYESLDEFDSRSRDGIERMLYDGETFIGAIPCWDFMVTRRSATKLILTDQRVVAYKRGIIRQKEKDVLLPRITSIGFKKGILFGKIVLKGAGFKYSNYVSRSKGRGFASEIRNQTR